MEVGEAAFEVDGWQRELHQTLSLGRDSFRVHQSLTFYTVRGEEVSNEHGLLNGRGGCFMVNHKINIKPFLDVPGDFSQPTGEKSLHSLV